MSVGAIGASIIDSLGANQASCLGALGTTVLVYLAAQALSNREHDPSLFTKVTVTTALLAATALHGNAFGIAGLAAGALATTAIAPPLTDKEQEGIEFPIKLHSREWCIGLSATFVTSFFLLRLQQDLLWCGIIAGAAGSLGGLPLSRGSSKVTGITATLLSTAIGGLSFGLSQLAGRTITQRVETGAFTALSAAASTILCSPIVRAYRNAG